MIYFHQQEIERILTEVVNRFLIPKFRELGMNATGEWLDSLEVTTGDNSGTIRGRDYSQYLAKGRGPNKNTDKNEMRKWAYGMANSNPEFIKWLQARGLSEYGVQIAYTIAKNGTTWHQKGGSDLIEVLESVEVREYITTEMRGMMQVELSERLIREAQEILL